MTKVRIYDLSKELNLENRDILQICEQLNIPFKSHSSTISESDAEQIKAMAAKYKTAQPPGKGRLKPPEPVKKEHKQEILAIHHKQAPTNSQSDRQTATLAPPPRSPGQSHRLPSPTAPASELLPVVEQEAVALQEPPPRQDGQGRHRKESGGPAIAAPKLGANQLLKPSVKGEREAGTEPSKQPPAKVGAIALPIGLPEAPAPDKRLKKKPAASEGLLPSPRSLASAKLELRAPQPPKPPGKISPEEAEKGTEEEGEFLDEEGTDTEIRKPAKKQKLILNRPTLPRASKKKISEEEEEKEIPGKATKGTGKGKRRQLLADEDEDLDLALETAAIPTSVSLSIARPPKPKSMAQKQPAAATTAKPKKAPVKADSSSARPKAERRERQEQQKRPDTIVLTSSLNVRELADLLNTPETDIIKHLFFKGIPVQITETLDLETARLVAEELGVAVETAQEKAAATKITEMLDAADLENLQRRPPVVTIMGHVDHGKTTLLDSIRQTKVAQGEAGGITQHIGAYHVDVEHNGQPQQIVFLDTPGHEAFTAMRARGARVTDIAILVVAADDGVQPQTREAISHAKAAEVPIVVAINKIDKPDANPDRIKQELSELALVPEEWGGDTIMVPVSALRGENLDSLLEMILLVSDIEELSANPNRPARGTVIEANLDRTRGPVATLLVQNGTLRVGDVIVAGAVFGKIRAMIDDRGERVAAATPSFAVEVLGISDVPAAGDEFEVRESEKEARMLAEGRAEDRRQTRLQQAMASRRVTLSSLSAQAQEGELKELNLILKADVQGSVEAILGALQQLPQNEVQVRVLLAAPGEITETDVDLAAASGAVIIGFSTTLASGARQLADQQGVDIREYDIIYKLLDDVQGAMEGLLEPEEIESPLGQAEVRVVFPVGRGSVAGCYVQSGKLIRNRYLRVRRQGEVIYQGNLDSLKRVKEDAREVNAGFECGIGISKFNDWQEGDIIEAYEMVSKRRTLSPK